LGWKVGPSVRLFRKGSLKFPKTQYWDFRCIQWVSPSSRYTKTSRSGDAGKTAKAALYSNGKVKPNVIIYKGKGQEYAAYYVDDRGK
jgi:hypothetical protein